MTSTTKPFLLNFLLLATCSAFSQKAEVDSAVTIACTFAEEVSAYFPGGIATWQKHLLLKANPVVAKRKGAPAGNYQVDVAFLVKKDGSIDSVKTLSSNGFGIEKEFIQAIQKMPKWSPAIRNGRNVPEWKRHFITFTVPK